MPRNSTLKMKIVPKFKVEEADLMDLMGDKMQMGKNVEVFKIFIFSWFELLVGILRVEDKLK